MTWAGALPQNGIDPVVLAAMIIVRLQTIVSRDGRNGLARAALTISTRSNNAHQKTPDDTAGRRRRTQARDLGAHLAYGAGTGAAFWLLTKIR